MSPPVRSLLTGSRFELADACEGALALPPARELGDVYAARGTAIHAFIDEARKLGRDEALRRAPAKHRPICAALDLDELVEFLGGEYESEVGLAYNPEADTARRIPPRTSSSYEGVAGDSEIPGSLDAMHLAIRLAAGVRAARLKVADWKTGYQDVEHPRTNPQLRFYALAAAREVEARTGVAVDQVVAMVVQFDEDGVPRLREATFDDLDLDAIAGEVYAAWEKHRRALDLVDAGKAAELVLVEGAHCKRCPALPNCAAIARAGQALIELTERTYATVADDKVPTLTPAQASRAWPLVKAVRAAADRMERALKAHALTRQIDLPGGKVVRPIVFDVDVLDTEKAFILADEMDLDTRSLLAETKLSKEGLKRAWGKELSAEFIGRLRERGGVTPAERTQFREVNAPKEVDRAEG